jgi:hypothetical protein
VNWPGSQCQRPGACQWTLDWRDGPLGRWPRTRTGSQAPTGGGPRLLPADVAGLLLAQSPPAAGSAASRRSPARARGSLAVAGASCRSGPGWTRSQNLNALSARSDSSSWAIRVIVMSLAAQAASAAAASSSTLANLKLRASLRLSGLKFVELQPPSCHAPSGNRIPRTDRREQRPKRKRRGELASKLET